MGDEAQAFKSDIPLNNLHNLRFNPEETFCWSPYPEMGRPIDIRHLVLGKGIVDYVHSEV